MGGKLGRLISAAAVLMLACSLSSCQQDDKASRLEIALLKGQVDSLQMSVNRLDKSSTQNSAAIYNLGLKTGGVAYIDPGSTDGYSMMGTSIGTILLSLEDVQPLADGSQITLRAGNPHAVSLLGISLNVKYGPRFNEGDDYLKWDSSLIERDVSTVQTLGAGSWTLVKFSLPGVKPDQLGHLAISGDINRVSLAAVR